MNVDLHARYRRSVVPSPRVRRRLKLALTALFGVAVLVPLGLVVMSLVLHAKASALESDLLATLAAQQRAVESQPRPVLWGEPLEEDAAARYEQLDVAFSDSETDVTYNLIAPDATRGSEEAAACERLLEAHEKDLSVVRQSVRCRWCRWNLSKQRPENGRSLFRAADLLFVSARAREGREPVAAVESLLGAVRLGSDLGRGGWNGSWVVERALRELGETLARYGDRL